MAATWTEPIFNRGTPELVYANDMLRRWKAGDAIPVDLRGCLNASDLNRIENNIQYLSDNLSDLYYFSTVATKTWNTSDLPTVSDIDRLIQNVLTIILSICEDTPDLPTSLLTLADVNSIESNINKIKMILDEMNTSTLECDTFECGEA